MGLDFQASGLIRSPGSGRIVRDFERLHGWLPQSLISGHNAGSAAFFPETVVEWLEGKQPVFNFRIIKRESTVRGLAAGCSKPVLRRGRDFLGS